MTPFDEGSGGGSGALSGARLRAIEARNKAVEVVATDKQVAYRLVISAVEYDPTFADGWSFLGDTLSDLGSIEAACSAYRTALALPDGLAAGDMNPVLRQRCLMQLGHRLLDNRVVTWARVAEAKRFTDAAIAMGGPATAFALTNRSLVAAHEYDAETELRCASEGFAASGGSAECELGLAFAELFNGRYAAGLKHFEARFTTSLPAYKNLPWPRWDGGHAKSLLVLFDMGLGDTLSFARFIPAAAGRVDRLVFQVQPELTRLIADALAPWKNVEVRPQEHVLADVECWCPVFSLPVALGLTDAEIRDWAWRPLPVKPVENTSWKARDARVHVAIAWGGMPGNGIDPHRSIRFEEFLRLREVPGIKLYSVQVGERAKELHDAGGTGLVRDMSAWIRDAKDTVGILSEMDAVVTVESFVGHLAGAMGKECYLLCSRLGRDWRASPYLGVKPVWYRNHKIFRQGDDCTWDPVFERVVEGLTARVTPRQTTIVGQEVNEIAFDEAARLWAYDPETGVFTWRNPPDARFPVGSIAGSENHGYWRLKSQAVAYQAHRIAWLLQTGAMPDFEIDHANKNSLDNRWGNLRRADRGQNCANKQPAHTSASGYRGVHQVKNRWQAKIKVAGKTIGLGTHANPIDAAWVYDRAAERYFGAFATLNFPDRKRPTEEE